VFLLTLGLVWVAASFVHELSHGLAAQALGGQFVWFCTWPGIQIWPHLGQPYDGEWGTSIAKTCYAMGPGWEDGGWQEGLVWLAGSGVNMVLAALALGGLWLFRPRGWLRRALIAETLMFEDILLYAILPEFFGLPHYLVYGGTRPEPVDGAEMLGCPRIAFVLAIALLSSVMAYGLLAYVKSSRDHTRTPTITS
jgi:hypothetical protein